MKLLVDFWRFSRICATWSLNCFCFDFQCRTLLWLQQTRTGKNPEINKQCHFKWRLKYRNNRSVSWRLSCILPVFAILHDPKKLIYSNFTNTYFVTVNLLIFLIRHCNKMDQKTTSVFRMYLLFISFHQNRPIFRCASLKR